MSDAVPDPLHLEAALDAHVYPSTRISRAVDRVLTPLSAVASWLWIGLLAVIVLNVLLRYAFGAGRIEFEELQWHLYSVGFLVGLAGAFQADAHIRVDVLRTRMRPTTRAWIELYGLLLLFGPFVALVLWASAPFVAASFEQGEISPSPGGLPLRWAIKAMLPVGFALLALAGLGRLSRVWAFLFGAPRPPKADGGAASGRLHARRGGDAAGGLHARSGNGGDAAAEARRGAP